MSIINPNTLRACDITSAEGRELLKSYIDIFMNGGTKGFQGVDNKKSRFQSAIFDIDDKTDTKVEITDEDLKDMHFLFDTTHDMFDYFDRKDSFWYKSIRNIENHFNDNSECAYKTSIECRAINKSGKLSWPQIIYGNFLNFKSNYVSNFNDIRKEIYKRNHTDILEDFNIEYRYDNGTIIPPEKVNMSNINFDEDKFLNKIKERWTKDGFVWNNDNTKKLTELFEKSTDYGIIKDVCMKSTYQFLKNNGVTKEYVSYPQFLDSSPSICNELSDTPVTGITTKYYHSEPTALWISTYNEMMTKRLSGTSTKCTITVNTSDSGTESSDVKEEPDLDEESTEGVSINFNIESSKGSNVVKIPITEKRQNWEHGRTPHLGFCSIEEVGILITAILQKRDLLEKSKTEFPKITFIENKNYNNLLDACIVTVPSETLFSDMNLSTDIVPLKTDISWFATYLNHQIMNTEYVVNERAILEKMKGAKLEKLYKKLDMEIIKSTDKHDIWYPKIIKIMEEMGEYGRKRELSALNKLLAIKTDEYERRLREGTKDNVRAKDVKNIIDNLGEQIKNISKVKTGGSQIILDELTKKVNELERIPDEEKTAQIIAQMDELYEQIDLMRRELRGDASNVGMGSKRSYTDSREKIPPTKKKISKKKKNKKKSKEITLDPLYIGKPKMLRELLDLKEKYKEKYDAKKEKKVIIEGETTLEKIKEIITKKINLYNALRIIEEKNLKLKDIILESDSEGDITKYFRKSAIKNIDHERLDSVLDTVFKIEDRIDPTEEDKESRIPVTQLEMFTSSRYYIMQNTLSVPVIRNKMMSSNFLEDDKFFSYKLWNGIKDLITKENYVDFIKIVLSFKALGDMSSVLMAIEKHSPTEPVVFVSYDRLCIAYILMMISIMQKEKNFKSGLPLIVIRTNLKGQITEYFASTENLDFVKPSDLEPIPEENEIKGYAKTILLNYELKTEGEIKPDKEKKIKAYVDNFDYTYPVEAVWENDGEYYDGIITNINDSEGTYDILFVDGDILKVGYGNVKSLFKKRKVIIEQLKETANQDKTTDEDAAPILPRPDVSGGGFITRENKSEPETDVLEENEMKELIYDNEITDEMTDESDINDDYFYSDLPSNMRDFPAIIYIADENGNLYLDEMGNPIVVRNDKPLDHKDDMVEDTPVDISTSVEPLETLESSEPELDTDDINVTYEDESIKSKQLDLMNEVLSSLSDKTSPITFQLPPSAAAAGGSI